MAAPTYVASDKTSITIAWTPPSYQGGCPVTDYEVQRDDKGAESVWEAVNPQPPYIRNDPYTFTFKCTIFPATAAVGDVYKFRIVATNVQGTTTSIVSRPMTLASVPGTPAAAPVSDASVTNGNQIRVTYTDVADNGGTPILSYELQMGSTNLKDFVSIQGVDPYSLALSFVVTKGIEKGKTYAFRYRAVNAVGAGPWSAVVEVTAATIPMAPPIPKYVSSTSTSITLSFDLSPDNGGSKIIEYKLFRDAGNLASDINIEETTYDGLSSTFAVTGLTAGKKYRFQYYANNFFGDSMPSDILTIAASTLPAIPNAPYIDWAQSTRTSLYIYWDAVADPAAPVLGYILKMDDGRGGQYSTIFDGSFIPGQTSFLKSGLTTGLKYSFKVHAVNFNGLSTASAPSSFYACEPPSKFAAPILVSQSAAAITIQWAQPQDNGGCVITSYAVFRDEGMSTISAGTITPVTTEVNSVNDPAVRNIPTLTQLVVTYFPALTDGFTFRFTV